MKPKNLVLLAVGVGILIVSLYVALDAYSYLMQLNNPQYPLVTLQCRYCNGYSCIAACPQKPTIVLGVSAAFVVLGAAILALALIRARKQH